MGGYILGAREIGPLKSLKNLLRNYAKTKKLGGFALKLDRKDITLKVEGIPQETLDSILKEKTSLKQKVHWEGYA